MSDARLFDVEEIPEVPLFREPVRRRGEGDARFRNEYPPSWDRCETCEGHGKLWAPDSDSLATGDEVRIVSGYVELPNGHLRGDTVLYRRTDPCPDCKGMGSLKAMVRLESGHRCVRCHHPWVPKGDAKMLGVERSGMHDCETCDGTGIGQEWRTPPSEVPLPENTPIEMVAAPCPDCKGAKRVWTPWSACDKLCTHDGPIRALADEEIGWEEFDGPYNIPGVLSAGVPVEAIYRILTVHHLDGDKANVRWWNLVALCQRCHLEIQAKVVMERVYPHEHSTWFRPYVAGYYAKVYLGEDLAREQVLGRMDELLALERVA